MEYIIGTLGQLGMVLQGYRKQQQLTQQQAAARAGMRAKTISRLETGRSERVGIDSLLTLLSALDIECVLRPKPAADGVREERAPEW